MAQDRSEYFKKYQQEHREQTRQASKKYRDNNPVKYLISKIKSQFKQLDKDNQQQVLEELQTMFNND